MDRYIKLQTIGKGSFGTVALVRRKSDNRVLVWKELDYGKMTEREKRHVVTEVNLLRELRHPFIVKYCDRIIDKQTTKLYIVMEYCRGGDLGKLPKCWLASVGPWRGCVHGADSDARRAQAPC